MKPSARFDPRRLREPRETPSPSRRLRAGGEEGQAILEFALIMPVLLMMLMAIVKFGVVLNNQIILTDAVAVGARTLALDRSVGAATPNACTLATTALDNAAIGLQQSSITVTFAWSSPSGGTAQDTCTNLVAGDSATVRATYPFNLQILFLNLNPLGYKLASQTTVRIE